MNPWDCLLPSPGQETIKRTSIINEKRKRSKDKTNTKEAKRRHFHVKQTRSSHFVVVAFSILLGVFIIFFNLRWV
jgi:hypothetical protein